MLPNEHLEQHSIQINFTVEPGQEGDGLKRNAFWDSPSTIQWFEGHGYTLYRRDSRSGLTHPAIPSEVDFNQDVYPFAFYDSGLGGKEHLIADPFSVYDPIGKVAFAQDALARHVAIKIVPANSTEYHILRFLHQQKLETLRDNCVMPVLDLLPVEGFWFAVMPRWGYGIDQPYLQNLRDIIPIMHSMLKGLAYLHKHNIVHGDIAKKNIMVNHFGGSTSYIYSQTRRDLRSRKHLLYAMIDFDLSYMLPPEADKNTYRLPYHKSWGTFRLIKDTDAGEFDFNPFVFDVGVMGSMLCQEFQHLTPQLPMLAPLLDKMTTWQLDKRFTASEALDFFEERLNEVSDDQLNLWMSPEIDPPFYDDYDRWQGLSPEFVEKWKAYRTAPLPWHIRFLHRLCQVRYFCYIVPETRLFFHRLSLFPLQIFRRIISLKAAI